MISKPDFMAKKVVLIYPKYGDKISFSNENIVVRDSNGTVKLQYSCWKLFSIYIVGQITITSVIILKAKKYGFSILIFSDSFKLQNIISNKLEGNTMLNRIQYQEEKNRQIAIAKKIVSNKINNQIAILKRCKDTDMLEKISVIEENKIKMIENANSVSEIMGFEGIVSKVYFNSIYKNFNWQGRNPRIKTDEINVLLDIGYTILFQYILSLTSLYGFDVYVANLHQEFYKRQSLVCDLIEPFRPIIDYKIRKMLNLGQVKEINFSKIKGKTILKYEESSKVTVEFLKEINDYSAEIFNYIQFYYRFIIKKKDINEYWFFKL